MTTRSLRLPVRLGAVLAELALVVAGCGGSGDSDDKTIRIGAVPGWTDQTGTAYLLKNILEDNGYTVEIQDFSDNAPIFAGLSNGDLELLASGWPERTHKSYWDQYSDDLEDLGTYYDDAALYLAVPEYSDAKSIEDLSGRGEEFGGKIIGIEAGSGLMEATKNDVIPAYGLGEEYELVQSSTTAMLTELRKAVDAEQEIVVTLWRPFWANQSFPVRQLDDPEGAFGESEGLHTIGRKDSRRTSRRSRR